DRRRLFLLAGQVEHAEALDVGAGAEVVEVIELAHLDLAILAGGIGEESRPRDRLLARLALDQRVAGDQLLRFGEGAVDHGARVTAVADAPSLGARLQAR